MFVLPVQSGQTRQAMRLLAELEAQQQQGDARQAFQAAGLTQIAWYVSVQPAATYLIAQIDGPEPVRGFIELMMAANDRSRKLRAGLGVIGGIDIDVRVIERLMHAPITHICSNHLAPSTERNAPNRQA
jgi:hypothetical protein